jgi:hypothetical protein
MSSPLVAILLVTHVALALALFVPAVLLPFVLRGRVTLPARADQRGRGTRGAAIARGPRRPDMGSLGRFTRLLLWLGGQGTAVVGLGVAVSGTALLVVVGPALLGRPWLLAALVIYAINLTIALFIQRPGLRRLVGLAGAEGQDADGQEARWRDRARRQRYVSYAMAGLTGTIGLLMSTKPELW